MDHRVSKDMISQGMSVTGEKKTEELGGSQYGSAATPSSLMSAYSSMYSEDAKWGYDPKTGKSLNPKDKKKVKEDVQQVDEIAPLALAAPLLAKAGGAIAAKTAAAGGAKALAGKAVGSLAKQAVADKAVSTVMGGNKKKEQVAASHELDGDVLKELQDSGLFSEEELKKMSEAMLLTKADKKANTPAWQNRDKKNVKTGQPIYKKADHLKDDK
tara:strand:+ start:185 stop:826 length:642 start_codon:yes stop_codon:yes gene_type:complete